MKYSILDLKEQENTPALILFNIINAIKYILAWAHINENAAWKIWVY